MLPSAFVLQLPVPVFSIRDGPGPVLRCVVRLPVGEARLEGVGREVFWQRLLRPILRRVRLIDLDTVAAICNRSLQDQIIFNPNSGTTYMAEASLDHPKQML